MPSVPLLMVMVALPAVLASLKNVCAPLVVMAALPAELVLKKSVPKLPSSTMVALPAMLPPAKLKDPLLPPGAEKVGLFEELLTMPTPEIVNVEKFERRKE